MVESSPVIISPKKQKGSKFCIYPDCQKRAGYNHIGLKGLYCRHHKLIDMIDVTNKRCIEENC